MIPSNSINNGFTGDTSATQHNEGISSESNQTPWIFSDIFQRIGTLVSNLLNWNEPRIHSEATTAEEDLDLPVAVAVAAEPIPVAVPVAPEPIPVPPQVQQTLRPTHVGRQLAQEYTNDQLAVLFTNNPDEYLAIQRQRALAYTDAQISHLYQNNTSLYLALQILRTGTRSNPAIAIYRSELARRGRRDLMIEFLCDGPRRTTNQRNQGLFSDESESDESESDASLSSL